MGSSIFPPPYPHTYIYHSLFSLKDNYGLPASCNKISLLIFLRRQCRKWMHNSRDDWPFVNMLHLQHTERIHIKFGIGIPL